MSTPPTSDVFEQVLLRGTTLAGVLHLSWIASKQGRQLVQVYINGRLYDVSIDAAQREMWLHTGGSEDVNITLLLVDAVDAWTDRSQQRPGELAMVRDEALPIDARVVVSVDGEDAAEGLLWSANDFRSGFGGLFGEGEFGRDAASAPGTGMGEFGLGPAGMDATAWRWAGELSPGEHELSLRVIDGDGRTIGEMAESRTVEIEQLPHAAHQLTIDDTFTLHITP